jgi:hypothetical protein
VPGSVIAARTGGASRRWLGTSRLNRSSSSSGDSHRRDPARSRSGSSRRPPGVCWMAGQDCGRSSAAAEHPPSGMVLTNGLPSFQHCQYSGTSRCTSSSLEGRKLRRYGISLDRQRNSWRRPITAAHVCNRFSFEQRGLCGQWQQRRAGPPLQYMAFPAPPAPGLTRCSSPLIRWPMPTVDSALRYANVFKCAGPVISSQLHTSSHRRALALCDRVTNTVRIIQHRFQSLHSHRGRPAPMPS